MRANRGAVSWRGLALGVGMVLVAGVGGALILSSRAVYAPLTFSGVLPTCGASDCLMQCVVQADAGWQCLSGTGQTLPVQQGTAPTVVTLPFSAPGVTRYARTNGSDPNAAYIAAGDAADAGLAAALTSDHTVSCAVKTAAASFEAVVLSHGSETGTVAGLAIHTNPNVYIQWRGLDGGTASAPTGSYSSTSGWSVVSAINSGTSYTARVNGSIATGAVTSTIAVAPPTNQNLYLGRGNAVSHYLGGGGSGDGLAWCQMWNRALSSTELARIEAQWFGDLAESRNVTTTRASTAWDLLSDGGVYAVGNGAPRVDDRGLLSYVGESDAVANGTLGAGWSLFHANLADGGLTTDPVLTPNACIAPDGTPTATKVDFPAITDTLRAGNSRINEGYTGTVATWTQSVFARAFDPTDGGTLQWTMNAAPMTACPVGASWAQCAGTNTNAAGANFSIGPDTRSFFSQPTAQPALSVCLWGAKAVVGSVAGPPIICGAAPCATASDANAISTTGWPLASGEVSFDFTPLGTPDVIFSTEGAAAQGIRIQYAGGLLYFRTRVGGFVEATVAKSWVAGQTYKIKMRWGGGNIFGYVDGVLVATKISGAGIPLAQGTTAGIGGLYNGTQVSNGWVKNLKVSR